MGEKEATQEGVAQTPRGARRLLPPSTPVALRCAYLTERAVLPEEGRKRGSSGGPAQGSLGSPPQRPWGAGGPSARRDRRGAATSQVSRFRPLALPFPGAGPPWSWAAASHSHVAGTCSSEESPRGAPRVALPSASGFWKVLPAQEPGKRSTGRSSLVRVLGPKGSLSLPFHGQFTLSFPMTDIWRPLPAKAGTRPRSRPLGTGRHGRLSHGRLHARGLRSRGEATEQAAVRALRPRALVTRTGGGAQSWGPSLSPETARPPWAPPSRLEHFSS